MIKFSNILTEGKDKKVKLTTQEKKILSIIEKKVGKRDIHKILDFLINTLIIEDDALLARLVKLFMNNYGVSGETFNEMNTAVLERGYETYDETLLALAEYLDIDPFYITKEWEGSKYDQGSDEVYLPSYSIIYPVIDSSPSTTTNRRVDTSEFLGAEGEQEAYDAAITQVREDLDGNGYEWFSSNFVEGFITESSWWADDEAETRALDDLSESSVEGMRDELYVTNDYEDALEEIEFTKKEIVEKLREIQELEFQRDNIEKEKIILEKEIETLGGDIEYDDENSNYGEFSEEIDRLQTKLNETENLYVEVRTMIEMSYGEKQKLDNYLEEEKEEIVKYSGQKLEDQYVEARKQVWLDTIEEDPLEYLEQWLDLDVFGGITEGYLEIDDESMIEEAVRTDGIGHFLASYNGDEIEMRNKEGKYYYFYRTN